MSQTWSPSGYSHHAGFVPALGASILSRLAPRAGERILDLGCGNGTLTEELVKAGAVVVGVDSSAPMVDAARALGLDARVGDAAALTFDTEFDAVFSNAALHWVLDADGVIDSVFRALRHGGRFVAEFGAHGNVAAIATAIRAVLLHRGLPEPPPWFYPTPDEYRARLESRGFRVEFIQSFARPTPLPTGMAGWIQTFRGPLLTEYAPGREEALIAEMVALLEPALRDGSGHWTADYVRLQVVAVKD